MSSFLPIFKKEIRSYYYSFIAYALTSTFLLIMGVFFVLIFKNYSDRSTWFMQMQRQSQMPFTMNLTEHVLAPIMGNMSVIWLFLVPLLTMRLFSEEKKSGTIELIFTYPIKDWSTILGKYFACCVVFFVMVGLTLLYPIFLELYGNLETGVVFTIYLGLILMGMGCIAFGILCSSLTENQIIAASTTFVGLLFFWIVGWASGSGSTTWNTILSTISFFSHFENFSKGLIDTNDVIYYILFGLFCLFLTSKVLESNKWRG